MDDVAENLAVGFSIFMFAVSLFAAGCWIGNVVKLTRCDFEAPYKGEIIHAVGLIPHLSIITVWNNNK